MRTPKLPLVALLSLSVLAACDPRGRDGRASAFKVLATVNGVPITERDVAHRAMRPGVAAMRGHEVSGDLLPAVVQDELVYQRAVELGLDRDPEYRKRIEDLETQVRALQRQEMATRFRAWVQQQAKVTEAEARAYFEQNAAVVRTKFHVQQIFYRGKNEQIVADRADLRSGAPFEEVAWRRFTGVPREGKAPWDLGELAWHQLPPAWRGVVDRLEPGQVSEVIQGEGERFWVVKLVAKRLDPAASFESERERIDAALRQRKSDELYGRALAEVKAKARIVTSPDAPATAATAARAASPASDP